MDQLRPTQVVHRCHSAVSALSKINCVPRMRDCYHNINNGNFRSLPIGQPRSNVEQRAL